jgi:hypothetical protein
MVKSPIALECTKFEVEELSAPTIQPFAQPLFSPAGQGEQRVSDIDRPGRNPERFE